MTSQDRRIPDSLLECYLADSLDALTRAHLEETLASSPMDRTRLGELRAESAAFLLQHPPGPMVERFQQERKRRRWWHWPQLLMPAFAAVLLLLVVFRQDIRQHLPFFDSPYTAKGSVILLVNRKTAQDSEVVLPNEPLAPGDSIRFTVKAQKNGFLAVLGRDAKGVVTLYHPYRGTAAASYDVTQPDLPDAFVLDDTLGREDLYTLYSERPFELGWAVQALEQGRDLQKMAPRDVVVGSTYLTKEKAR
ncbi:MAG TPA: hypothetical protein VF815_21575 [Myxococcaceae bacterium]|jgi:hypothetical protein